MALSLGRGRDRLGPGDRVEVRLDAVGADEAVPEPPAGLRASMLYGAVQLSWDAAASSGGVDASYQVWREDTGPGAAGLVQLVQVDGAAFRDSDIAAGSAYRYGASLQYGQGARSAVSGTVTVQVPPLLADSAPGLERIAVGTSPGVALDPGRSRYDVTLDGPVGETRVELQANAFDAALQGQMVAAADDDAVTEGHQVALNAAGPGGPSAQTAIIVVVSNGDRLDSYTIVVNRDAPPSDDTAIIGSLGHLFHNGLRIMIVSQRAEDHEFQPVPAREMGPLWTPFARAWVRAAWRTSALRSSSAGSMDSASLGGQVVLAEHEDHPSGWE